VAEDLGFFDASAFSRIFRREFGCAPSEVRAAACPGGDIVPRRPSMPGPADSLTELLRALR
jgi:AraC-like DNA-binding protein